MHRDDCDFVEGAAKNRKQVRLFINLLDNLLSHVKVNLIRYWEI